MEITKNKKIRIENIIMPVCAVIIGAGMGIIFWILVWALFVQNKIADLF